MNRKNNGGWSTFIFNTVLTLAVLIILMQVNNLEVLNLNQRREAEAIKLQIARLARSVDQLQAKVKGVQTSDGNSQSAYVADVKFLHPQVKNFFNRQSSQVGASNSSNDWSVSQELRFTGSGPQGHELRYREFSPTE